MTELLLGHQEAQRSEYLKEQQPVTLMCTRMEWSRHEAGGGGGVWCAVSFSTECERPRSLSDCMHELYTQNVLEISLTD